MMAGRGKSVWRHLRWGGVLLAVVLVGLIFFWDKLPYQTQAARQIIGTLEQYDIANPSLRVERISTNEAVITDVAMGNTPQSTAARIMAQFTFSELKRGYVRHVEVDGLHLAAYQRDNKWWLAGLEPLLSRPAAPQADEESLLFDAAQLAILLPENILIKEAMLDVTAEAWSASAPFEIEYNNIPSLKMVSPMVAAQMGEYKISTGAISLDAALEKEPAVWKGTFSLHDVALEGLPQPVPVLAVNGRFDVTRDNADVAISIQDKAQEVTADITLHAPLANMQKAVMLVKYAGLHWGGGVVSVSAVKIPFGDDAPIRIPIRFHEVALEPLLDAVSDGKVQATGRVSGTLPIVYHPGGKITLEEGGGSALEQGSITVAPELLPQQAGAEMDVLRSALSNFNYTALKIAVSSDKNDKSMIRLTIEGNNPNAFEGRPIKLNVNLGGDLLPLIQQSLLPINDLQQLLKTQEQQ